ncbi:MAG: hypothetical protein IPG98_04840 [Burkholderiales bacterium]|nr:hypothetical protein [Burkholderiales bacterium]
MRVQFAQLLQAAAGIGLLCGAAVFAQAPAATPAAAPVPPAAADAREGTFKTVQGDVTVVRGKCAARPWWAMGCASPTAC